jgi:predicted transcriptional regulator of viral defense system
MDTENIKKIFDTHDGIMRTKELYKCGVYYRLLAQLVQEGYVEKIRYGYYQWQDDRAFSEAATIAKLFPDAILCMETALQYYGYTDRTSAAWCLAVDKNSTKSRFDINYPAIKPFYMQAKLLEIGVESCTIDDISMKIYDRERVICDCLRQMNKMDVEIYNKAIQAYIKDPKKNIPRLMIYAKKLRAEKKVRSTIGVWL